MEPYLTPPYRRLKMGADARLRNMVLSYMRDGMPEGTAIREAARLDLRLESRRRAMEEKRAQAGGHDRYPQEE